jgi:hypothetical protein
MEFSIQGVVPHGEVLGIFHGRGHMVNLADTDLLKGSFYCWRVLLREEEEELRLGDAYILCQSATYR